MGAAPEGALRSLLQFLISCRDMFFSLKRGVGDLSYTSFSSSSLVGTMSADTLIACPLACQAQSSMYRSVTRSYTSLFSRKYKREDSITSVFKKSKITLIFIRDRNLKKLKILTSLDFSGPSPAVLSSKSQQTVLRARSYAQ